MDRDPERGCRLSRHKRRRNNAHKSPTQAGAGGLCPPGPPEIYRFGTNPGETQQKRDAPSLAWASRLRSWSLARARVASPRGPVLRPGHGHVICDSSAEPLPVRAHVRDMPPQIRPTAAPLRESAAERNRSLRGRVLSRTEPSACVIRDPGRSFLPVASDLSGDWPLRCLTWTTRSRHSSRPRDTFLPLHKLETSKNTATPLTPRTLSGKCHPSFDETGPPDTESQFPRSIRTGNGRCLHLQATPPPGAGNHQEAENEAGIQNNKHPQRRFRPGRSDDVLDHCDVQHVHRQG